MKDGFGREIDYLRISVTESCNQRCIYCMPREVLPIKRPALSDGDIVEIAQAAAALGVKKIRLTGGEPLSRPNIAGLCEKIGAVEGIEDLSVTTNATLLAPLAKDLKAAGVKRINISLDTLDPDKFRRITRGGDIKNALAGLDAAFSCGMEPIKINTVLMGGINDDEIYKFVELTRSCPIEQRFIELMPIGDGIEPFPPEAFIPCSDVLKKAPRLVPIDGGRSGVAKLYRLPDGRGTVGLISPLSDEFCADCRRLRITADGCIKPCLHSSEEIHLRGLHGAELQWALKLAAAHKPQRRCELSAETRSQSKRGMYRVGG